MLESIDPFGQRRDDYRVAVLAQVIVAALGGKKADGATFTAADFLKYLDFEAPAIAPGPPQTVAEIERRIASWVSGSNRVWQERGGR